VVTKSRSEAIPGWTVEKVGALASFSSGEGISVAGLQPLSHDFPVPVYGGNGIAGYTAKPCVNEATIIIGRVGQKCGEVHFSDGPAWITDNALYPKRVHRSLHLRFLGLALSAAGLNDVKNRNDLPLVTQSILHAVEIPWPVDIKEQATITAALSDMDALIGGLERLIAKKRHLKQAAVQQLLTGHTRLPGYSGKWESVAVGELFMLKNGLNKAKEFFGTGTPIVNYMDVYQRSWLNMASLSGRVSVDERERKAFDVQRGDVFFTRTSETVEEIGLAAVMLDACLDTVFSGFLLRARPKNDRLCDSFKKYCFQSESIRRQIVSRASYTTRALTNGRLLSSVVLNIPGRDEQAAIAEALSDMDAELAVLEQRRDKTRLLKQGMMQELLAGRTRLL